MKTPRAIPPKLKPAVNNSFFINPFVLFEVAYFIKGHVFLPVIGWLVEEEYVFLKREY